MRYSIPLYTVLLLLLALTGSACSSHEDRVEEARKLIKAGKAPEALKILNAVIKEFPPYPKDAKYAEAFYQRGLAHSRATFSEAYSARSDFSTCARLKPDHLECVYEAGIRGPSTGMLKAMNTVIDRDPKRWAAYKFRARGRVAQRSFDGVEGDLKIYLENRPGMDAKAQRLDDLELNRLRAAVAASKGDFPGAYDLRAKVGPGVDKYDGDWSWSRLVHGLKEAARGGDGRANSILRKLGISRTAFLDEARTLYAGGRFEEAAKQGRAHLAAMSWTKKGKPEDEALVRAYEAAAKIAEGNRINPLAKGKDFRKESNKRKAVYDQAIRKAKSSLEKSKTVLGYRLRGEANCRRGYYTDGFKDLDAATALKPGDPNVVRTRALCTAYKKAGASSVASSTTSGSSTSKANDFRKLRKKLRKRRMKKKKR